MNGSTALVAAEKVLTEDTVRPGLIGGFFFVALAVATYFLWRSMNKQLRRVDAHFAETDGAEGAVAPDASASTDSSTDVAPVAPVTNDGRRPDPSGPDAG